MLDVRYKKYIKEIKSNGERFKYISIYESLAEESLR